MIICGHVPKMNRMCISQQEMENSFPWPRAQIKKKQATIEPHIFDPELREIASNLFMRPNRTYIKDVYPSQFLDRDTVLAVKMVPLNRIFFMIANWFELHKILVSISGSILISNILVIDYVMFAMSYLEKRKKIFVKNC